MDRLLRHFRRPSHHDECVGDSPGRELVDPLMFEDKTFHGRAHHHDEGMLSEIKCDKKKFQVNLNVQDFQPDEINVRTMGKFVIIEGNQEERQNVHSFTRRNFVRRYLLPENVLPEEVLYSLSPSGVLKIEAPRGGRMRELMGIEQML